MTEEFKPLLKNSKFVYVWVSQILSQLTIYIMNFLLLTVLFDLTGSAIATSLLWVAYALPAIVVGPFGAALVDMADKRKILIVTNFLQALVILVYALSRSQSYFLPYGVVLIYSFLNQFYLPAESAAIPAVVTKKHLPLANGLFFITQQGAIILGFALAGGINHLLGFERAMILCSVFIFGAFVSVTFLPKLLVAKDAPKTFEEAFVRFFGGIVDGYHFIKENNKILIPLLLLLFLQVILAVITVNVPALATNLFSISLNYVGIFIIVPGAVGALLGGFLLPKMLRKGFRKRKMIEGSLKSLAFAFLTLALIVPQIPGGVRLLISALLLALAGFSFVGVVIPSQTFLQEVTPGGLRGRVFGNFWFIVTVTTVLPVLFSGAVTELLGVRSLIFVLGILFAFAVFFSKKYAYRLVQHKLHVS